MIRLRPATLVDILALGELTHRCDATQRDWAGPGTSVPSVAAQETAWRQRLDRTGAWAVVAVRDDDDGRIAGACAFAAARENHVDGPLVPGVAHVSAVFVDPGSWRQGIARTLLQAAEDEMRGRGYTGAQLLTLEGSPAERLYAALGWQRTTVRRHFPLLDLPTVQYVKALRALSRRA